MKSRFRIGQRWCSETEPELGMGLVAGAGDGRVLMRFPASGEERLYAEESAPLRRVRFRAGAELSVGDGTTMTVESVEEHGGVVTYRGAGGRAVVESELSDALGFGGPLERWLQGRTDGSRVFDLRREALEQRHRRRRSPVRGFVGGRIDLIPHQLYIAAEVTGRQAPRVLLSDEVGLGKTIEAGLIVHRLLGTGRAGRVLVVVPEPLVHQWFVELLRRFNLWFHLFDEERCDAVEAGAPEGNPFLDEQLVLCGLPLLRQPKRAEQAAAAGWDLLVVDEAHHLRWSPEAPSEDYRVVEKVGRRAEGMLLLTATPEQLGLASHFARLRLLDPDRYYDLEAFEAEAVGYGEVASIANRLMERGKLGAGDLGRLAAVLGEDPARSPERLAALERGEARVREEITRDLLDRHGTGRVMFRNTRAAMKGFPRRVPRPTPLPVPADADRLLDRLAAEFDSDVGGSSASFRPEFASDPRVRWLADWLRRRAGEKVLLICRTREKAEAIDAALRTQLTVASTLFHEGLELVQRDRNAAWFAEPEGARILIASEIGSEGRNFQFAHHLVLFDLPLDPELVEQRIGRLDRIGQSADVEIHVPYVVGSPQEALFRWFHEGLDVFGHNLHAGRELLEEFGSAIRDLAQDYHETHETRRPELDALIGRTREVRVALERRLEQGRDRLLELNSFRPERAKAVVEAIRALDEERQLDEFLLRVWDHYGVPVEDVGPRTFKIGADGVFADRFPGLPADGVVATLDRRTAAGREDMAFLTWDHPMVTGALDLLLGGHDGTAACVAWPKARERGLWLETLHVLECVAPPKLQVDRFLPATPIRVVVDLGGEDVTDRAASALARAPLRDLPAYELLDQPSIREWLGSMAEAATSLAEARAKPVLAAALEDSRRTLGHEVERLRALAAVNSNVRREEIEATERQRAEMEQRVSGARLRLDAVRVIVLG